MKSASKLRQDEIVDMTDSVAGHRKTFHQITDDTGYILRSNKSLIEEILPIGLDAFYDHISEFPEAKAFFRDRTHMMHAKTMQIRHWSLILEGGFGADYVSSVTRIGEVHNRIGLEPKWFIGAYNFLLCALLEKIAEKASPFRRDKSLDLQKAVTKAVMIDMDYAIAVYLEAGKRERVEAVKGLADRFEGAVGGIVAQIGDSARGLDSTATTMSTLSEQVLSQTSTVAGTSEETSTSVQAIAAASEQLVASISEISRQVSDAARLASEAAEEAARTSAQIADLSSAADDIGGIVNTIKVIAGQTNLLALNATIEAARAGDHGRGFAVVAAEVKGLADQTSKATETISAQIAGVQASTARAVNAIDGINKLIVTLSDVADSVSTSVERQGDATHEISNSILHVAAGTSEVATNIAQIAESATDTAKSSDFVLNSARDLGQHAEMLRGEVRAFLDHARSN